MSAQLSPPHFAQYYPDHLRTLLARTDAALNSSGFEQVAIHSGLPKVAFQDDYHYPFKPNPNFLHYLPLTAHPHSFMVYRRGGKPQLIFMQPHDYWHVVPEDPKGYWVEYFDIRIIRTPEEAKALIDFSLRTALVAEDAARFEAWEFVANNPPELLNPLHWQRAYKTPYEVECIAQANRSAALAHEAARKAFVAGCSEYAIHLNYLKAAQHAEHELPYSNIIALNNHGAVLHYTDLNRQPPAQSQSFLIDAGAQCNGYAADITRTYAASANEFHELIEAMNDMELALVERLRPGKAYLDVHIEAHFGVAKILKDFDFVKGLSEQEMLDRGVTSVFFPHGIGHLLGLQVHDIAGKVSDDKGTPNPSPQAHPYLRLTRTIEKDMVFTIEPGLYFIDMLLDELKAKPESAHINWSKIEIFKKFGGIRIEDNVLVTVNGTRNLTREAFAALKNS